MRNFIVLDDNDVPNGAVQAFDDGFLGKLPPGWQWVEIGNSIYTHTLVDVDGVMTEIEMPNLATKQFARARAAKWSAAKERRQVAEHHGCMTPLGFVQTDAESQTRIGGAVQMALLALSAGQPFSLDWTMADNSVVAHDASKMIAMGQAVAAHVAACHAAGRVLRAAIEAAADMAALEAIDINQGWPV